MKKLAALIVALALAVTMFGVIGVNAASYMTQNEYEVNAPQSLDVIKGNGEDLYTPGCTGDYLADVNNIIRGPGIVPGARGTLKNRKGSKKDGSIH